MSLLAQALDQQFLISWSLSTSDIGDILTKLVSCQRDLSISSVTKWANGHWHADFASGCHTPQRGYKRQQVHRINSSFRFGAQRWCITTALLPYEWAEKVSECGCNSAAAVVIFLAHFGPLSTNWALFNHHGLPEYYCWPRPSLYDYSVPSSDVLPAG